MSLAKLRKLSKQKHISEFDLESMVTEFGLYESVLIDMIPIECLDDDEPHIDVSQDVKFLQLFLLSEYPIMLPCPDCRKQIPFYLKAWGNPSKLENTVPVKEPTKKERYISVYSDFGLDEHSKCNVFEVSAPFFRVGDVKLVSLNSNDMGIIKKETEKSQLIEKCIDSCRSFLLTYANEIRRNFYCGYNQSHHGHVSFRIYNPIELEDDEEYYAALENGETDLTRAYEYMENCLIIQKVGQYPSLADMQLFNVDKYRSVLGKDSYRDLTRAIGLNADGIGAGAFLYLRRILEKLVEKAHQMEKDKDEWDEKAYTDLRFDERIKCLEKKAILLFQSFSRILKQRSTEFSAKAFMRILMMNAWSCFRICSLLLNKFLMNRLGKKN